MTNRKPWHEISKQLVDSTIGCIAADLVKCPVRQVQNGILDHRFSVVEPGDFIDADPPYDVEFVQYAKQRFSWQDQIRLVD